MTNPTPPASAQVEAMRETLIQKAADQIHLAIGHLLSEHGAKTAAHIAVSMTLDALSTISAEKPAGREAVTLTDKFRCEYDESDDAFTISWNMPEGERWLVARPCGQITVGLSPYRVGHPPVRTSIRALSAPGSAPGGDAAGPSGWKLVPVEPTDEMFAAAAYRDRMYALTGGGHRATADEHWAAMIAAAPTPPDAAQERGEKEDGR